MEHAGFRPPPGFFRSTARIASSKTVARFVFFFAEHSTKQWALIFDFSFLASAVVTNLSEFWTRKSAFVPVFNWERTIELIGFVAACKNKFSTTTGDDESHYVPHYKITQSSQKKHQSFYEMISQRFT